MSTRFLFAAAITATSLSAAAHAALYVPFNQADPVGSGWTQSMGANDDGSSSRIEMGMTFCFYETDQTSLFINNNGNVTFDGAFSTFTPFAFPSSARPMIAPFFADVDTRNRGHAGPGTNLVWHKSIDSDNNGSADLFVVTWDTVGYFGNQVDKLNTFQLVLSADEDTWGATPLQYAVRLDVTADLAAFTEVVSFVTDDPTRAVARWGDHVYLGRDDGALLRCALEPTRQ